MNEYNVEDQKEIPVEQPPESPVENPAEIPQEVPAEPATTPEETPVEDPEEIPVPRTERRDIDAARLKQIIEGALLAIGKPLPIERLESLFLEHECPERAAFEAALVAIGEDCMDRGFELKKVASGYRFQVKQDLAEWVGRLWEEKPQRYSRALMETLSIVAYRQPITRGDIEKIRGVAVSTQIVQTLLEHEWIRVVGHRDVPGRPAMYATTKQFLDYFNLESLDQLPPLSEIRDLEEINRELSLDDSKPVSRIIEFPDPEPGDSNDEGEDDEAIAAAAIGTRPISEILSEVDARLMQGGHVAVHAADENLDLDLDLASEADFDAAEAGASTEAEAETETAPDAEDDPAPAEDGEDAEDEHPPGS